MRTHVLPAFLLILANSSAQAPTEKPTPTIRHDATTMLVPAGSWKIKALIDATAKFLGRNILCDERELMDPRPVELQSPLTLDRVAAEDHLTQVLYSHGLVLVMRAGEGQLGEVISSRGARQSEIAAAAVTCTEAEILARPDRCVPVQVVVELKTINAQVATNALRPFFGMRGGAGGLGLTIGMTGGRGLLLCGLQPEVAKAIQMLYKSDGREDELAAKPAGAVAPAPASDVAALIKTVADLTARVTELERRLAEMAAAKSSGK